MKAKARASSNENPTEQPHLSRLVRIVNLGNQPGFEWQGEMIEPSDKLEFTFEICDENMKDGRPFFVSKEINNTDSNKGTLYAWMQALGGSCNRIEASIGEACMLTPRIKPSGWSTIDNVAGLPAAIKSSVPALVNEPIFFDFWEEEPDMDAWDKLYEKEQKKVLKALDIKDYPFYAKLAEQDDI